MASRTLDESLVLIDPLAVLPLFLSRRIFALLPVDSRAKAACVSRSWRDVLADPSLWERLDLSWTSGVPTTFFADVHFEALLLGAAKRAHGRLRHLDVTSVDISARMLLEVLEANADSLRSLHLQQLKVEPCWMGQSWVGNAFPAYDAIIAAVPALQILEVSRSISCDWNTAPCLIRSPLLQFSAFSVICDPKEHTLGDLTRIGPLVDALSDVSLRPALQRVSLARVDLAQPQVSDAIVDAALARRVLGLAFVEFSPPHAASLARLLEGGAIEDLVMAGQCRISAPLFNVFGAALVSEALRNNTTLTGLLLLSTNLFGDERAAELLLGALVAHQSLQSLTLTCESGGLPETRGALLAALVAADAPALQSLNVSCTKGERRCTCKLGDAGLGPLVDALPRNRHLRLLSIPYSGMSDLFARRRLLPAVRRNIGLLELKADGYRSPAALEAEVLVASRRPGAPPRG